MGFKFRMDVVSVFGGISCKYQEFCRILPLNKIISARYFMQFQVLWNVDLWNI